MISDKEKMQIRQVVDQVIEARLMEFSEIQLQIISNMLLSMTDKYVESLMKLARMMNLPEDAAQREGNRMAELMMQGMKSSV